MRTPKERLMHLLKLAAEGEGARAQLVHELSQILIDWPREYAPSARLPFETLLEKTVREADAETRTAVVENVVQCHDAPIGLLNQLYFSASPEARERIIARNDGVPQRSVGSADFDEDALLIAARHSDDGFQSRFAREIGLSDEIAGEVLRDESGRSLAVVLKGTHARRTTFSALAILISHPRAVEDSYVQLESYDAVPLGAAERMLAHWRSQEWLKRGWTRSAAE